MTMETPTAPGEGVKIYAKNRNSPDVLRIRKFCKSTGLPVRVLDWTPTIDYYIGLTLLQVRNASMDAPLYAERDFNHAATSVMQEAYIQTFTVWRRGETESEFIGSNDQSLFDMGEGMAA